jgi:hypothetical protein
MKCLRGVLFGVVFLTGILLVAFGDVLASQNGNTQTLETSSLGLAATPTLPSLSRTTPTPKPTRTPLSNPTAPPIKGNQPGKLDSPGIRTPNQPSGTWQLIASEGFESAFPSTGWTVLDLNHTYCQLCWDDASYWDGTVYRAHAGSWAAWPPRGGTNGYSPYSNINYTNNMNTRMIYGPFDLSNAVYADADFYLWREIEPGYDYLAFEVSHTGNVNDFQELARWDGSVQQWVFQDIYFNDYIGDNSVWVAWRFYSDYSVTYQGPWVDDIRVWKYVPGQVTVQGYVHYYDRTGTRVPAQYATIHLWDANTNGVDYELTYPITTTQNGFFQFPTTRNWEYWDSGDPDHALDLYIVVEATYNDSGSSTHRVTYFSGDTHKWRRGTSNNVPDGIVNLNYDIPLNDPTGPAMWIFQDLRRAWEYVRSNSTPQTDPGSVTAIWQAGQEAYGLCNGSCFYAGPGGPYIFIAHNNRLSADAVVHEASHHYMYNATQWWWWHPACWEHDLFSQEDANCAWSEGWSDFLAIAVNQTLPNNATDTCYDRGIGPCGAGGGTFENLETHTRNDNPQQFPWGDTVEGRVAGALYDLVDPNNEAPWWDSANFGFAPIWNIVRVAPHETTFFEFWNSWKASGNNKHHAVRAIYQNTIDYDTSPRFNPLLPDRTVLQNLVWNQAIDLWAHSEDDESADTELGWQILSVTDPRCGVSLNANRYVNIAPQQGWLGSCDVTISVSDSIKASTDTFRVNVVPVASRNFLPIILK